MCFLTIYMFNFSLNNTSYFGVISEKVELQIRIKLENRILSDDKLGFCCWFFFLI